MENNLLKKLRELHVKAITLVHKYEALPEKDITRKHIELMASQIATSSVNLQINLRFAEKNEEEFKNIFGGDIVQAENYVHNVQQSIVEAILDTALFQTELVLRFIYSHIMGGNPTDVNSLHKIIATLFDDTENNWKKEEAKLFILFWTMRNTIHTGGIYYKNPNGYTITYKGKNYKFDYMKALNFLDNYHMLDLLSDFLDSLDYLFESQIVKQIGSVEHPSYHALDHI